MKKRTVFKYISIMLIEAFFMFGPALPAHAPVFMAEGSASSSCLSPALQIGRGAFLDLCAGIKSSDISDVYESKQDIPSAVNRAERVDLDKINRVFNYVSDEVNKEIEYLMEKLNGAPTLEIIGKKIKIIEGIIEKVMLGEKAADKAIKAIENIVESFNGKFDAERFKAFLKKQENVPYLLPIKFLVAGLGGAGKTTFMREVNPKGEIIVKTYDNALLEKGDRPEDTETGKPSEDFMKKFEHEKMVYSSENSLVGSDEIPSYYLTVLEPVFGDNRGRIKMYYNDKYKGIMIKDGAKSLFVKFPEQRYLVDAGYLLLLHPVDTEGNPDLAKGGDNRLSFESENSQGREFYTKFISAEESETGQEMHIFRSKGTEYIYKRSDDEENDNIELGVDVYSVCFSSKLGGILEEKNNISACFTKEQESREADPRRIICATDKNGKPYLEYKDNKYAIDDIENMRVSTLKFSLEKAGEFFILGINGHRYRIPKKQWNNTAVAVKTRWFELSPEDTMPWLERHASSSQGVIFEGVGVIDSEDLDKEAIVVEVYAYFPVRLRRIILRGIKEAVARGVTSIEELWKVLTEKRLDLLRTEEMRYLIEIFKKGENNAMLYARAVSHSLAESLFMAFEKGKLRKCNQELETILGLKASEIENALRSVSRKEILKILKQGFVDDISSISESEQPVSKERLREFYTKEQANLLGLVLVAAKEKYKKWFQDEFLPLIQELEKRLGDKMVRHTIINLRKQDIIVDNKNNTIQGRVIIKNSVFQSLEHRCRDLIKEYKSAIGGEKEDIKEEIINILVDFLEFNNWLGGMGVVAEEPCLKQCAYRLIADDKEGKEELILNDPYGFQCDNDDLYDPDNFSLDKITHGSGLEFPDEIADDYKCLRDQILPEKEEFTEGFHAYTETKSRPVPDAFDMEIIDKQISEMERLTSIRRIEHVFNVFKAKIESDGSSLSKNEVFILWIKCYDCLYIRKRKDNIGKEIFLTFFEEMKGKAEKGEDVSKENIWQEVLNKILERMQIKDKSYIYKVRSAVRKWNNIYANPADSATPDLSIGKISREWPIQQAI